MIWLLTPLLGVLLYYTLILTHCAAHDSLPGSKRTNQVIGYWFSLANLFDFTDFQALHVLHHTHTNTPGKDPHFVRPGESWLHYVLTHYCRLIAFTFTPYYRSVFAKKAWEGQDLEGPEVRRQDRLRKILVCSGRLPHQGWWRFRWSLTFAWLFPILGIFLAVGGWAGLEAYFALWIVPWAIGQILVADFNYRGHVGLPERQALDEYHGQDTRSEYGGLWPLINWATMGFYLHREHHLDPKGACLFTQADDEVRQVQEGELGSPA